MALIKIVIMSVFFIALLLLSSEEIFAPNVIYNCPVTVTVESNLIILLLNGLN